jgi:hypothetical protein
MDVSSENGPLFGERMSLEWRQDLTPKYNNCEIGVSERVRGTVRS